MKKIKLKLEDIIESDAAFAMIQSDKEQKPSFKLGYRLAKISRSLTNDVKSYQESMQKFFDEHGKKDDKGNMTIDKKNTKLVEKHNKQKKELLETEVEVEFQPIPMYLFEEDEMKFNTAILSALLWCIDESADKPPTK